VTALDGLRGLAALAVVFHHTLIASSAALYAQYENLPRAPTGSLIWWLSDTPLHIFWAGQEAVIVFFVLSGFVLAIPAVKLGVKWFDVSYYPRRLARLYLPVWGALIFASVLHLIQSRHAVAGASPWLNLHSVPMTLFGGLQTASLASWASDFQFTSVLWSLRYEVVFSVLLPGLLLLAVYTRSRPWWALLLAIECFLIMGVWGQNFEVLRYMPVFVLGMLMAFHMDRLNVRLHRLTQGIPAGASAVLAICLLTVSYWTENVGAETASALAYLGVILGACLLVWLGLSAPAVRRLLDRRVVQWAGSRSFSLYLVHEPIVVTVAFALGGKPNVGEFILIVVPLSLLSAEIFWRVVERPAIRVARWLGDQSVAVTHGAPIAVKP
jgi:peptidoglycan/LPS O-acetylase OafA/YrhL